MNLRADSILAIPTINVTEYVDKRLSKGARWNNGTPHVANTNFALLLRNIHHLAPSNMAAYLLYNGGQSSKRCGACREASKLILSGSALLELEVSRCR
jgi:type I restriction enzyme M protein